MSVSPYLDCTDEELLQKFLDCDANSRVKIIKSLLEFRSSLFETGHINSFRHNRYDLYDQCTKRLRMCIDSAIEEHIG